MRRPTLVLLAAAVLGLAGCDLLGIESASQIAERREAEGKAIGGACRHAARSIEDCYEQNRRAEKAAIFAGWREMNDYMRENKLEPMPASPPPSDVAEADAEGAPSDATVGTKSAKPVRARRGDVARDGGERAAKPAPSH